MNGTINMFKTMFKTNKKLFIIALLVVAAFVLIGCTSTGDTAAPSSQYIGGGCG